MLQDFPKNISHYPSIIHREFEFRPQGPVSYIYIYMKYPYKPILKPASGISVDITSAILLELSLLHSQIYMRHISPLLPFNRVQPAMHRPEHFT